MIDIVELSAIGEGDLARQWVKTADLFFDRYVRVLERRPAKRCNRLSPDGCIDRVLRLRQDFVQHLV